MAPENSKMYKDVLELASVVVWPLLHIWGGKRRRRRRRRRRKKLFRL